MLRKADMVRKNAVESVQRERNILVSVRSPFVVRLLMTAFHGHGDSEVREVECCGACHASVCSPFVVRVTVK